MVKEMTDLIGKKPPYYRDDHGKQGGVRILPVLLPFFPACHGRRLEDSLSSARLTAIPSSHSLKSTVKMHQATPDSASQELVWLLSLSSAQAHVSWCSFHSAPSAIMHIVVGKNAWRISCGASGMP